jgi:hypothetical protein
MELIAEPTYEAGAVGGVKLVGVVENLVTTDGGMVLELGVDEKGMAALTAGRAGGTGNAETGIQWEVEEVITISWMATDIISMSLSDGIRGTAPPVVLLVSPLSL